MDMTQLAQSYVRIWNADAPRELVDEIFLADFVDHNPQPGQQADGVAGIHQVLDVYHVGFPGLRVTTDEVIVSGDRAVVRWTAVGTHEGALLGIPASQRDVRMTGIDILRIADGLIVERWGRPTGCKRCSRSVPSEKRAAWRLLSASAPPGAGSPRSPRTSRPGLTRLLPRRRRLVDTHGFETPLADVHRGPARGWPGNPAR